MNQNKTAFGIVLIIIALVIFFVILLINMVGRHREAYNTVTFDNFIQKVKRKRITKCFHDYIITPLTPYILCDHFVSKELTPISKNNWYKHQYWGAHIDTEIKIKANDLLLKKNYNRVKNNHIIAVEVTEFENFMKNILPSINAQIILFTCKEKLPQIQKSDLTDQCLNHPKIKLWISQNPIYPNSEKYMAFPYGFNHTLTQYIDYLCKHNHEKTEYIFNPPVGIHGHLPKNHIRLMYPELGKNIQGRLAYDKYLEKIATSKYTISTTGDRDDCFRHYEAIGLNSIPISNVSSNYKNVFNDDMIYMNAHEMIDTIKNHNIKSNYRYSNKNILLISYWSNLIRTKIL